MPNAKATTDGGGSNNTQSNAQGQAEEMRTKIVQYAKSKLGIHEGPGNSNPFGPAEQWCGLFVNKCWQAGGAKVPASNPAYVPSWIEGAKAKKMWKTGNPIPGDAVCYGDIHIGIIVTSKGDTIEGNTGNGIVGRGTIHDGPTSVSGYVAPAPGGAIVGDAGSTGTSAGIDIQAAISLIKATDLATELEFPSILEGVMATGLQGQKSLMNDKPLLPWIQQLCDASLRKFQSMPDGTFFAFYPDYFGEMNHREPYWLIEDIEITDGTIELTDDSLATHAYVIGDTTHTHNEVMNTLFSGGVMTIFTAFQDWEVLSGRKPGDPASLETSPAKKDVQKDQKSLNKATPESVENTTEAIQFLQRYGARPIVQDMPMIKSPFFEMFYAYQLFMLMWSSQFRSTFAFTFMPELYPGGKVGFPNHGLQMYIEEVSHDWDLNDGFRTAALLSAPSSMGDNSELPPDMVRAIIEPVSQAPPEFAQVGIGPSKNESANRQGKSGE